MSTIIVTGSGGLIGSQAVTHFAKDADRVIGIDNNMRQEFFGPEASTDWVVNDLSNRLDNYTHGRRRHPRQRRDAEALR